MLSTAVSGAVVNMDLIGGLGDFEWSTVTTWGVRYNGSDFDWNAQTDEWYATGDHKEGTNISTPDDSVAPGWRRWSSNLNPGESITYQIAQSACNGSNCQFFALKDLPNTSNELAYTTLDMNIDIGSRPCDIHAGDTVVFKLDYIRMQDYNQQDINYEAMILWDGGKVSKVLPKTTSPYTTEVSATIPSGVSYVIFRVGIFTTASITEAAPGIYVDGAHILIRRAGNQNLETETIPFPADRTTQTIKLFFDPYADDVREVARNYDRVMLAWDALYPWALRLKYYNPQMKVYLYQLGGYLSDHRPNTAQDGIMSPSPLGFKSVMEQHPEWLYACPVYPYQPTDPRAPDWKQVPYYCTLEYAYYYYAQFGDPDYQELWKQAAVAKVNNYHLDGIVVDAVTTYTVPDGGSLADCQSFVHHIVPTMRNASIEVLQVAATQHLDNIDEWGEMGSVHFDPTWQPDADHPSPGYEQNSGTTVSDGFLQEYAFFSHSSEQNNYDGNYWLRCLSDMDKVSQWNNNLPDNQKKWIHMMVRGVDRSEDPAYGPDGWLHFGVASYLLAQHNTTALGVCTVNSGTYSANYDFSITRKLGNPVSPRERIAELTYLRRYYGNSSGADGGIVVVNGNAQSAASFYCPYDMLDENGALVPYSSTTAGSPLIMKPHTGRILLHQHNYKYVSVIKNPVEGSTINNWKTNIIGQVAPNRPGLANAKYVQVRVDNGQWKLATVNKNGEFSINWFGYAVGKHTIECRAYVNSRDYEPAKIPRTVYITRSGAADPME